jgi:FkbH-like protein
MTVESVETLGAVLEAVAKREAEGTPLAQTLRLSILRNYTVETMVPFLKHACYRAGLQPEIAVGDYDNIVQEVLSPESHVYSTEPDLVVINWVLEHLDENATRADWDPAAARSAVLTTLRELTARTRALVAVSTFLPPLHTEDGIGAAWQDAHRVRKVHGLNQAIREFAAEHAGQVFPLDVERIVRKLGEDRAIDERFWAMYRAPFKKDFVAQYADQVVRIGRALKGRAKKCLILDCDNTLWGGVVGEDGLDKVALDRHEYPGKSFRAFQQSVLNLIDQGVIVALCSKNNEADVWELLDGHPHNLLKREHLAAWRINWEPKSENIASLARELNLGLDSMVFVDDSGTECDLVRQMLPEVTVLQVPSKTFELPSLLYRDGLFDGLSKSDEDRQRTAMYAAERERSTAQQAFESAEAYLASLGLSAVIHRARPEELTRVAQLVGKTNQFNLTTRRHSEAFIREMADSPESAVYTLTAADRFGDLGLVGVLIARKEGVAGVVDSLLLSCRALGRKLELAFVHTALDELDRDWGVQEWKASYLKTAKNAQVEKFWNRLGFDPVESGAEATAYSLEAARRSRPDFDFITITS